MFGTSHIKSIKQPFYTYSMRDAIHDGLVLDVTQHYSTVAVLAKMSQSTSASAACNTIEKPPPGLGTTPSVGPLQLARGALQCVDPSTPVWLEASSSSDAQRSDPNTAVYSEARKAAYHMSRVPGNDVVWLSSPSSIQLILICFI